MDCIVVGGCADGQLLRKIRADAAYIELKRPQYLKPLAKPTQMFPDIHHESDTYEVHPIALTNSEQAARHIFGIAAVDGMTLTEAFTRLVTSHVEAVTMKLSAANLLNKQ